MKFDRIDLHHIRLEQAETFETSVGRFAYRDSVVAKVYSDVGITYGEAPALPVPCYCYETTETTLHVLRDFIGPAILGKEIGAVGTLQDVMAFVRGHPIAKSAVETAWCHLAALESGVSLSKYLGGSRTSIEAGISIGIQPTLDGLAAYVARALALGYARIKIKIKPGWDVEPVAMLRTRFGQCPLMVDANGAYTLDESAVFRELDQYDLLMIEQPLAFDDICDHAVLQRMLSTPLCLDESIDGVAAAREALALEACRVVNIKLSRVGGFQPAMAIHDLCAERGVPVWCGGMFESAIGKADCIALASLPNFQFPGDIAPSSRYFTRDLISPFVTMEGGRIQVPTAQGLGFQVDEGFLESCTVQKQVLTAPTIATVATAG